MSCLVICPHCSRHVRMVETACPFCGGNVAGMVLRCARSVSGRGLSRATVFALVAAGMDVVDCGGADDEYGAPSYYAGDTGGLSEYTGGYANCRPAFGPCPAGGASATGGRRAATGGTHATGGTSGGAGGVGGASEGGPTDASDGATRDVSAPNDASTPDGAEATDASREGASSDAGSKDGSAG